MGKGKKTNPKKIAAAKLSPAIRSDVTKLVDSLIKKCSKVSGTSVSSKQECEDFKEIYDTVEKIRELESSVTLPVYDRDEEMKNLFKWAEEQGIKWSVVRPTAFPGEGYGLVCDAAVQQNDEVLMVPLSVMLTDRHSSETYLGPLAASDPLLQDMGNVRLALLLLLETLNPESKWAPYLRCLPRPCLTPLFCTPKHIERLKHSPVLEGLVKQYRNIARQYAYFYRIFLSLPEARDWPLKDHFTYDAYRWAVCCVSTRVNQIPTTCVSGGHKITRLALVPCWDLVNHEHGEMTTAYIKEEQVMRCYANRAFAAGEQFTMNYGRRCSADLFLHAGFVVPDNPYDSVHLRLGLSKADPLQNTRQTVLTAMLGEEVRGEYAVMAGKTHVTPQLRAFAIVFSAEEAVLNALLQNAESTLKRIQEDDEYAGLRESARTFLVDRMSLLLRSYKGVDGASEDADPLDALVTSLLRIERSLLSAALEELQAEKQSGGEA